jgi:hypothetical protein
MILIIIALVVLIIGLVIYRKQISLKKEVKAFEVTNARLHTTLLNILDKTRKEDKKERASFEGYWKLVEEGEKYILSHTRDYHYFLIHKEKQLIEYFNWYSSTTQGGIYTYRNKPLNKDVFKYKLLEESHNEIISRCEMCYDYITNTEKYNNTKTTRDELISMMYNEYYG